jgi:hypothetical protein
VELVALDPGILAVQLPSLASLAVPGDRLVLQPSGPFFHDHLMWFVDEFRPDYDPNWTVYHMTFRVVDTGNTGYTDSDPFTLKFALAPVVMGDMNCDGALSVGDISGFVAALTDPDGYAADYPDCDLIVADLNGDGFVSVGDIAGFVSLLTAP